MDRSAITPQAALVPEELSLVEEINPAVSETMAREKTLAGLADHPGWELFCDLVKKDIDNLRRLDGADISQMNYEEVGQRFLVASLAAEKLENALDRVRDIARNVDKGERS